MFIVLTGDKILDCGCGVGGPMRTIAAVSGAHVVGITINEYQVSRATHHNQRQGLAPLTTVVRGDFTDMPFEDNSFDGAYAIEATCHAPEVGQHIALLFARDGCSSWSCLCTNTFLLDFKCGFECVWNSCTISHRLEQGVMYLPCVLLRVCVCSWRMCTARSTVS